MALVNGRIGRARYVTMREACLSDLEAVEMERRAPSAQLNRPDLPDADEVSARASEWKRAIEGGDVRVQRTALTALIEHVVPVRIRRGSYAVRISWTPLASSLLRCVPDDRTNATINGHSQRPDAHLVADTKIFEEVIVAAPDLSSVGRQTRVWAPLC